MTLGDQERNKEFELKKEIKALKAQIEKIENLAMSAIIMINGRFANERIKNYEEVPEVIEQSGGIS
nr:MAG TPA: hypothetical protein [Caudoviricetes sp.]